LSQVNDVIESKSGFKDDLAFWANGKEIPGPRRNVMVGATTAFFCQGSANHDKRRDTP